jgi:hypothetical protein
MKPHGGQMSAGDDATATSAQDAFWKHCICSAVYESLEQAASHWDVAVALSAPHWRPFPMHAASHCEAEMVVPLEDAVPPDELPPEELPPEDPPDEVDVDEVDPRGPSPFVVVVHAANAAESVTRTSVDFIIARLPC